MLQYEQKEITDIYGEPFVSKSQYLIANCRFINTATDLINTAPDI